MDNQDFNTVNEVQENVVDSQEVGQVEAAEKPVNAGSEEVTPSQVETKPVQTAEDNARFAEVRRKAESEARDKVISEMYGDSHGIHTYADYQKAVAEQAEQARQQQLIDNGMDPEIVKKYISEDPTVKRANEILAKEDQQAFLAKEVKALEEYAPGIDVSKLDPSVVKEFEGGKPLVDAYIKYENAKLKADLEAFKLGSTTLKANEANAQSTPGSLTGNGGANDQPLTAEMVNSMSEKDLSRRWKEVKQVLGMK